MLRSTVSTTAIKAPSESQIRVFSFISALFAHKKNQREEIGEISSKLVWRYDTVLQSFTLRLDMILINEPCIGAAAAMG